MISLVLGGARSGKSVVAERLVSGLVSAASSAAASSVTYVATIRLGDRTADPDLVDRVQAHRDRRPDGWRTVEAGADLADVLRSCVGTVLLDSLGPWVAGTLMSADDSEADGDAVAARLCAALLERQGDTVVVSEEVGFGVHPSSAEGRRFRDRLGSLNQAVSTVADEVYFVIAGRAMRLPDISGPS